MGIPNMMAAAQQLIEDMKQNKSSRIIYEDIWEMIENKYKVSDIEKALN